MSIFDRFYKTDVRVKNVEANEVYNVGVDDVSDMELYGHRSENWDKEQPLKIKPTIANRRRCANTPTVFGILNNLIFKTISSSTIDGDDEKAVEYILECDKTWDLKNKSYECLWNCMVDGEMFYEYIIIDNFLNLRPIAFDGDNYQIKKLYDENAQLIGYAQWVAVNRNTNKGWMNKHFFDIYEDKEWQTVTFEVDDISNPIFINVNGRGKSLVRNVIDTAYEVESLNRMLAPIVFKSANVMTVTMGNSDRKEVKMTERARKRVAEDIANYHKKGVITLPYGVDVDVVGDNVLPKIQDYIKVLKSQIYEGLVTPESLYSSESSNRSTAQVQLTDNKTGHVLFIEYAQEFLKKWIERDIINKALTMNGFKEDSVWIDFMTEKDDLDTTYLEKDDKKNTDNQDHQMDPEEDEVEDGQRD